MFDSTLKRFITLAVILFIVSSGGNTQSIIQSVYQTLLSRIGEKRADVPELLLVDKNDAIAEYNIDGNRIEIEQFAIDLCRRTPDFGAALGFLTAHELAHFYQIHEWGERRFDPPDPASTQKVNIENEADVYAAFACYLAGFNAVGVVPQLFDEIYREYGINDGQLPGYHHLSKRKSTIDQTCEKVAELIRIHKAAQRLFVIGQYEQAAKCNRYLLHFVKCKEIYGNLGLAQLYSIRNSLPTRYLYPGLLESNDPFNAPVEPTSPSMVLKEAIRNLEMAASFNENTYYHGFLNLSMAYIMDDRYREANTLLMQLKPFIIEDSREMAVWNLVKGNLEAEKKSPATAERYFAEAWNHHFSDIMNLVDHNRAVLAKKQYRQLPPVCPQREENSIGPYDHDNLFEGGSGEALTIALGEGAQLQVASFSEETLVRYHEGGRASMALIWTSDPQYQTEWDCGAGTPAAVVEDAYDGLYRQVPHTSGYYIHVPCHQLFFNIDDATELVTDWGIYNRN